MPTDDRTVAFRRAGFLLYAALQFVALTAVAMLLYGGGNPGDPAAPSYAFLGNFFSDLGATTTWWGHANGASAVLFAIALGSVGIGFVAFAGAWRGIAFDRRRVRWLGVATQLIGTLSGLGFVGIACTPVNLATAMHNRFVLAAFSLLLVYVVCLNVLWWCNGVGRRTLALGVAYIAVVAVYVAIVVDGARTPEWDSEMMQRQVAAQKAIVYGSMVYIVTLTIAIRRRGWKKADSLR